MSRTLKSQRGMALVVGLILLAVMTLMVIASFNIGRTSLDIVGNMQRRAEVVASANSTIQQAVSTTRMFTNPSDVFVGGCAGNNTRCFDINADGTDDITVALDPAPTCIKNQIVPNGRLDYNNEVDRSCATQAPDMHGVAGVPTGNSKCANTMWEIVADAMDAATQANVQVTMGAAVRVSTDDVGLSCP